MKRSVKLIFSTNALFLLFSMATSLLSAWALKPEGRGELAVATMWTFIFSHIGTFGLPFAHRYWAAAEPDWNKKIFTNTLILTVFSGAAMILAAWFILPILLGSKSPEIVRLAQFFALNIPIILLNEMLRGQLEGARLFGWLGLARLAFIAVQAIGNLTFYLLGILTLENAIGIIITAQLVCSFLMFRAVWRELAPRWNFDWRVMRQEVHYGLRSYPGILTEMAVWRLDQMMLAIFAASAVVGLYAVAVAIAEITATLASSVADALLPEVASSTERSQSADLMGRTLRLTLYAQFLVLIPLWLAAPYILGFVYGEGFVAATTALRLLLIASIIWSASMIVISGLNGLGHPGLSTIARLCSSAVTVVSLVVLLPRLGINGAAVSSILGYGTLLAVALFYLLRKQKVTLGEFLRPRRDDVSIAKIKSFLKISPVIAVSAEQSSACSNPALHKTV